MKTQFAWILGGGSVVALAMVTAAGMTACSPAKTGEDGGSDAGMDVMQQQDVVQQDMGTQETSTCPYTSPPSLHATAAGTIFCGYLPDGGPSFDCDAGQQCCLGGSLGGGQYAPEQCGTWGSTCDNPSPDKGVHIECGQTSDCTADGKPGACCLQGESAVPAEVTGCPPGYLKLSGGTGIMCEGTPTCTGSGDLQLCTSNAECGDAGKVCTPFRWKIYQIGYCM